MGFTDLIRSNAEELQRLHEAIHKTVQHRSDGPKQREKWETACRTFHESYDRLAFPGGISRAIPLLEAADPDTIEMTVRFLEADPWFFRSGYLKAELIQRLRRVPLTDDQRLRLQTVVIERVCGRDVREFRWYCRLASLCADQPFISRIAELTATNERTARHAFWVLSHLQQTRHDLTVAVKTKR